MFAFLKKKKVRKSPWLIILFLAFVLAGSFFVYNYTRAISVAKRAETGGGLVGHWTLDEKDYNISNSRVTDKSPFENHGVNSGATFSTDRFGKEGGAMYFDGSGTVDGVNRGAHIIVPESATDTRNCLDGCTYSLWLKVDENAVDRMSLFWGAGTINHIEIYSSGKNFRTEARLQNGYSFGTGKFPDNVRGEWSHFTIVFAENEPNRPVRWYQNGKLFHTGYMANGTYPDTEYFSFSGIGRSTGSTGYNYAKSFHGSIDDVRIYNRALSEEEIKSLYDSYSPKTTTGSLQQGLILDMPLKSKYTKNETAGSEVMTDRSAYSNDGNNIGAVITSEGAIFNGSSNYISNLDIKNKALFEPSSITVSSWINLDTDASTARHIWFTKWYGYSCEIEANTRIPYFRLNGPGDVRSSKPIVPGEWHHFVGTYDPIIGGKVYLDGELVGSRAANGNISHSQNYPLNIGRYAGGIYFDGKISNALIYNRALSEQEVKTLYDRGRNSSGIVFRPYGSSQDDPGLSCKDILDKNPSALKLDGLYWIDPDGSGPFKVYCDMTTDGGGWTLVLLSNKSKQYCPNVNWESSVNGVNYNGLLSSDIESFDLLMGLKYWNLLGTKLRLDMGASKNSLSHRTYQDFSINAADNYKISMTNQVISIGGSASGFYSYHNNMAMTTYDKDNDVHSTNCSSGYNKAPWWYRACWSGSFWGGCGAGYQDAPFWTGSGSEYFNYGSIWAR